jgi:tRNA dimethylallyltransferase
MEDNGAVNSRMTQQHHFIQNKSIFENYTVGEFEKKPLKKIDDLFLTDDYVIWVVQAYM